MDNSKPTIENLTRLWDSYYNIWIDKGLPDNDPNYPVPGPHPNPYHKWNQDREELIQNLKTDAA